MTTFLQKSYKSIKEYEIRKSKKNKGLQGFIKVQNGDEKAPYHEEFAVKNPVKSRGCGLHKA